MTWEEFQEQYGDRITTIPLVPGAECPEGYVLFLNLNMISDLPLGISICERPIYTGVYEEAMNKYGEGNLKVSTTPTPPGIDGRRGYIFLGVGDKEFIEEIRLPVIRYVYVKESVYEPKKASILTIGFGIGALVGLGAWIYNALRKK